VRIVFISGPLWSPWWFGRMANVLRAARVAWRYWRAGNAVICPHLNSGVLTLLPFCGRWIESTGRYLDGHIEMIKRLDPARDEVHFLAGWHMSSGASQEHLAAVERRIFRSYLNLPETKDNEASDVAR